MIVYINLSKNSGVSEREVKLKDVASIWCDDSKIASHLEAMIIERIPKEKKKERIVHNILDIIELVKDRYPDLDIESVGETDFVIDYVDRRYDYKACKALNYAKVAAISVITFFGSSYAIMAYNNDVGTTQIFSGVYRMFTGDENGDGTLEVAYSAGIFAGIVIFFNHLGRKQLTNDPTPMEVEMRNYEEDLDLAIIKNSERRKN